MKFGVREICDVVLRAKAKQKLGSKTFYRGEPVLKFDSLKTSTLEGAATTVYATGGRGNSRLIAWEGEKTMTFTFEDALLSTESFSVLSGANLTENSAEKPAYIHKTAKCEIKLLPNPADEETLSPTLVINDLMVLDFDHTSVRIGVISDTFGVRFSDEEGEEVQIIGQYFNLSDPNASCYIMKLNNDNSLQNICDCGIEASQIFYDLDKKKSLIVFEDVGDFYNDVFLVDYYVKKGGYETTRWIAEADNVEGLDPEGNFMSTDPLRQDLGATFTQNLSLALNREIVELQKYDVNYDTGENVLISTNDFIDQEGAQLKLILTFPTGQKYCATGLIKIISTTTHYGFAFKDIMWRNLETDEIITGDECSQLILDFYDTDYIGEDVFVYLYNYVTLAKTGAVKTLEITPDKFAGNYYLEAKTLFRRESDGVDMPAEFVIPNGKIQSNFTFAMASSGDPSTFTFTMDAFPDYTKFDHKKKVLAAIQVMDDEIQKATETRVAHI